MLNNFRNLQSLFWSHGIRWLLFRVSYALRRRTGYIRVQMPEYQWKDRPLQTWLKSNIPSTPQEYTGVAETEFSRFFFEHLEVYQKSWPGIRKTSVEEANRILSGELKYFSHAYYQVGFPPDWHTDPVSGVKLDSA